MEVSRSRFYDYLHSLSRSYDPDEIALKAVIRAIFKEHRGRYGSRRITTQLKNEGHQIGRHRVRNVMKELHLKARVPKRYKGTTDSRHSFPIAANLLDRKFDVAAPNTCWTTDITYVWTFEGWFVGLALYSRQILGWAMEKQMKEQLTLDALVMAYCRRRPPSGLPHHSDRGSQYACHDYREKLNQSSLKSLLFF